VIDETYIVCDKCGFRFNREETDKHCSNCFACTGCEIYYCPVCDFEIIITPIQSARKSKE